MKTLLHIRKRYVVGALYLAVVAFVPAILQTTSTHAAALSNVTVRFDRMQISTATTGTVCANPVTTATEGKVLVTFPTGYTLGTAANFTVTTTNLAWPTGATAWPGITTATAVAGQTATFTSGDLTVGTLYCFNWNNSAAVTQPSTAAPSEAGSVATQTSAAAAIDSASYSTATITNDSIAVSATVPQSFSFALSGNTDSLPALSTAGVSSSPTPRTVTVNTNAKNGWTVWAKDANTPAGLNSPTANYTISTTTPGTNSTLTAGTEGYNTGVTSAQTSGNGVISVAAPFVGGTSKGGGLDNTLRPLATSTGTANNGVLTLTNNVAISAVTPAATDYADTIYVVGAGLF